MLKRLFILCFLALAVVPSFCQRPQFRKMSPLVRQAYLSSASRPRLALARDRSPHPAAIMAFVKVKDGNMNAVEEHGAKVWMTCGNLCVAEIPLDRLGVFSQDARIIRIEADRNPDLQMDVTPGYVNALDVYSALRLHKGYTGKGVVVGVQDVGFDLTHPNFYSADMYRYRIVALWDQLSLDTIDSHFPVGRAYEGREELLDLKHSRDGLQLTHGTHTAGIAAGSGAEGEGRVSPYRGMAYESDICLVANAVVGNQFLIPRKDYYKYTFATDALGFKYIFDYARRMNKPCVINFSEGSPQDFSGSEKLQDEMLAQLVGPGRIIVASAGNEGRKINYVHKPSGVEKAGVFCKNGGSGESIYFYTKSKGCYDMDLNFYHAGQRHGVTIPLTAVTASKDSMFSDTLQVDTMRFAMQVSAYCSDYDKEEIVCDWNIDRIGTSFDKDVKVSLTIRGGEANVEMYRFIGTFYHDALDASLNSGDHTHSIYSPSSSASVISVGATGYRTHFRNYLGKMFVAGTAENGARADFSSVGPTLEGRVKPDVMAPGQNIVSSYNSYYLENHPKASDIASDVKHFIYNGRVYPWNSNAGTSMSAPVVAGVIALWLEANPNLTTQDCIDIFKSTCTHYDQSLSYPNNLYGYGQIDAYQGVKEALRKRDAAGIDEVEHAEIAGNSMIYTIDGICVGSDASKLSPGLYVCRGKKIFVKNN